MSIQKLPGDVAAQIRSSTDIVSLNSVACGLVKNSLDAAASRVNISVDYGRGDCTVEDDGRGIPPSDFRQGSGLGELYCTSKYPASSDCHGKQGTFLAAVAALSLLSVTSHHIGYSSHNSLTIHNCNVIARNIPALPDQRLLTFAHGTRVSVRDLFGSMPVRVKQRAQEASKSGSGNNLDQLLVSLVALLVVWPGEVTVALRDANGRRALILRTADNTTTGRGGPPADPSVILQRTPRLLAQASLYEGIGLDTWVPIGASAPGITIAGCVCLRPVATRRLQFVAVGIEPLLDEYRSNFLYEEVNRVFASSAFGVAECGTDRDDSSSGDKGQGPKVRDRKTRKAVERWPAFYLQVSLDSQSSPFGPGLESILRGEGKAVAAIADLLRAMFYEFLKKHYFQPKPVRMPPGLDASHPDPAASPRTQIREAHSWAASDLREESASRHHSPSISETRVRRTRHRSPGSRHQSSHHFRRRPGSPFDLWSKVKAGRSLTAMAKLPEDAASVPSKRARRAEQAGSDEPATEHSPSPPTALTLVNASGNLLRKPFADTTITDGTRRGTQINPQGTMETRTAPPSWGAAQSGLSQETVVWVDPMTSVRSTINRETGSVANTDSVARTSTLPPCHPGREIAVRPGSWIHDILSTWGNPAFAQTEAQIPRMAVGSEAASLGLDIGSRCSSIGSLVLGDSHDASSQRLLSRISTRSLREAEIIGHVDMKFVLAKARLDSPEQGCNPARAGGDQNSLLVLIDQHAADERCRVEDLMRSYFTRDSPASRVWTARTEALQKPMVFELPHREGQLIRLYQGYFEAWGVSLKTDAPRDAAARERHGHARVQVQSLPPSILERCRIEPKLVSDILRKEIWRLHDEARTPLVPNKHSSTDEEGELDWVRRFHGCPPGIVDLINSRSCRSAIMFNDPLTLEQCRDLVQRLTECAFPFQCAHGRPSMVPLVDMGTTPAQVCDDYTERAGKSLAEERKEWRAAGEAFGT